MKGKINCTKMPFKNHGSYNAITDDLYDVCIPLHNDVAFDHGIHFEAKVRHHCSTSYVKRGCKKFFIFRETSELTMLRFIRYFSCFTYSYARIMKFLNE